MSCRLLSLKTVMVRKIPHPCGKEHVKLRGRYETVKLDLSSDFVRGRKENCGDDTRQLNLTCLQILYAAGMKIAGTIRDS